MRNNVRKSRQEVSVKRDDDLVREILLAVEAADAPLTLDDLGLPNRSRATIAGHVELLEEAGFLVASFAYGDNVVQQALIDRLTWDGHEFLNAIRDETTWSKTKATVAATAGSVSFDVLKTVASAVALKAMGL